MKAQILTMAVGMMMGLAAQAEVPATEYFRCQSLPSADSSLTVVGVGDGKTENINLVVFVGEQVAIVDAGQMDEQTALYSGQYFTLQLNGQSHQAILAAAQANPVLSVGQAETLECQF